MQVDERCRRTGLSGAAINSTLIMIVTALVLSAGSGWATDYTFVTTTDYVTGSSSVVHLVGSYTTDNDVASLHSDAVSRFFDSWVYVVNRYGGDNIQILDPNNAFSTVRQFSVGPSTDPHDIVVLSDTKAYVTRYNASDIWIVDPSTGTYTGSIGLSGLADGDGIPEMDQMARVGDHVFVTIQRLDRNTTWGPVGESYVAVIDITTDTLVDIDTRTPGDQSILLTGTNPATDIRLHPWMARLYVSSVGFWGLQDGGVEIVNPAMLRSEGYLLTESAAGGDVSDVVIVSDTKGYAIIIDASFHTVLIAFDPGTGIRTGTLYTPGDFVLNDIELSPNGELFLADRTPTQPGIRIYDVDTDTEITTDPIDVGLPPFDITFSVATQTGIDTDAPLVTGLGLNYPNPFNPATTIPYTLEKESRVTIGIYDAAGRLVRTLVEDRMPAGPHETKWNGLDKANRHVPSGAYFAKLDTEGHVSTRKLILIK